MLREEAGFDFAVVEECAEFDECEAYEAVYGDHVIAIEYDGTVFLTACSDGQLPESAVLRDRDLSAPEDPGYVFELCSSDE